MALNLTGGLVTAVTASPQTFSSPGMNETPREVVTNLAIATGNLAINSVFYAVPLPLTCKVSSIKLALDQPADTSIAAATLDIGIALLNSDGTFTTENATCYASAYAYATSLTVADLAGTEVSLSNSANGTSGTRAFTVLPQAIWADAGLTSAPGTATPGPQPVCFVLTIKMHATVTTAQAANMLVKVSFLP